MLGHHARSTISTLLTLEQLGSASSGRVKGLGCLGQNGMHIMLDDPVELRTLRDNIDRHPAGLQEGK